MDAPGTSLPTDVDSLQSLVGDLQSQLSNLQSALYNKEQQLVKLQEQLNLKQQRLYGKSTEKLSVDQLEWDFFNEAELLSALAQLAQEKEDAATHASVGVGKRNRFRKNCVGSKSFTTSVMRRSVVTAVKH